MAKKKGLGKGLGALLVDENSSIESDSITELKIMDIEPNRNQPRKAFDEENLIELADSIKQNGVITPILVCEAENGYYSIIAGERRWRASKLAGLKTIPAIILPYIYVILFGIIVIILSFANFEDMISRIIGTVVAVIIIIYAIKSIIQKISERKK